MAGNTSSAPSGNAFADGKLTIQLEKSLTLGELLAYLPEAQVLLDEILKKGWRYYFIEGYGTAIQELGINRSQYRLQTKEHLRGGLTYMFLIDFGRAIPKPQLKGISNLQRFIVNICGKYYPRSVTIDIAKNEVTYVHDSLWGYKGEQGEEEAKDILNILRWLIEEKKFKLGVNYGERYQELVKLLRGK